VVDGDKKGCQRSAFSFWLKKLPSNSSRHTVEPLNFAIIRQISAFAASCALLAERLCS
jgi:hypothetical protein